MLCRGSRPARENPKDTFQITVDMTIIGLEETTVLARGNCTCGRKACEATETHALIGLTIPRQNYICYRAEGARGRDR